jgi:hypothetical protein
VAEDNQDEQNPQWMKRLRWSKSGLDLIDERLNALASLWAEGALRTPEIVPEVCEAIKSSTVRPEAPTASDFMEYTNNVRTAAGWMALLQVIHFCEEHYWRSQDERVHA